MTPSALLDVLWRDYAALMRQADRIRHLLSERGAVVHTEHVGLRTFGCPEIGIGALAAKFEQLGWEPQDRPRADEPPVRMRCWRHSDRSLPEVRISELVIEELSPHGRGIISHLLAQVPPGFGARDDLAYAGRPWQVTHGDYRALLAESEYAAWVAAFGFRVHHFTVDVTALSAFPDLTALDTYLSEHGFSSTRPASCEVAFSDATVRIPSASYEFAWPTSPRP